MNLDITNYSSYGGCSAKISADKLNNVKRVLLNKKKDDNLLIGIDNNEDAAVYKINDEYAIITTVDVNTPLINDPYLFGQIAACNALSDVYAKGGTPITCLNICGCPEQISDYVLQEIFSGAQEKVNEAEALIVGGHTIKDPQLWYGLSVTGSINPKNLWQNSTLEIGDVIIITKPIGTGIMFSVNKFGLLSIDELKPCVKIANTLNKYATEVLKKYKINAVTDVTGFGLGGHLLEMLTLKKHGIDLDVKGIPVISNAMRWYDEGYSTSLTQDNIRHIEKYVEYDEQYESYVGRYIKILSDPQTNGGLLISIDNKNASALIAELIDAGLESSSIIGFVTNSGKINMIL
ncbi:MAG: selenide, water dikinase SelD [Chlorobaculum sp.]|nr:selenide, water dikinase SelD [Chlorobaculum sp.]